MHNLENTSTPLAVIIACIGYSLCSSTLLLANKVAINFIPNPALVSFLQILFAALAVMALKFSQVTHVDWFEPEKVKAYMVYVIIFVCSIYTNMQALSASNVETVIVFRACTPMAVCLVEYHFMGRQLPSLRSSMSLFAVAFGAIVYCINDSQLVMTGASSYFWVIIYFFFIVIEMTYGKILTSSVKMESVWGPVLYCNSLAVGPMLILGVSMGDLTNPSEMISQISGLSSAGWGVLIFSCLAGTMIGYTGWLCRGMTSATTFTLVGVVNKFLTVLLNLVVWDKHSTPMGTIAVCLCLGAGFFYQQAPRTSVEKVDVSNEDKAEKAELLAKEFELGEMGNGKKNQGY